MKRGVVIGGLCSTYYHNGGVTVLAADLKKDIINTSLLYWDRIDIPQNNFVYEPITEDMKILIDEGVLTRENIYYEELDPILQDQNPYVRSVQIPSGQINPEEYEKKVNFAPYIAFLELLKDRNTLWSFIENSETVLVPNESTYKPKTPGLLLEFHQALPQPNENTPFEEILEFKNKNKSELLALRTEIDSMCKLVSESEDFNFAKSQQLTRLRKAIDDISSVARENAFTRFIDKIDVEITEKNAGKLALAMEAFANNQMLGGMVILASCPTYPTFREVFTDSLPCRSEPMRYIYSGIKEKILPKNQIKKNI